MIAFLRRRLLALVLLGYVTLGVALSIANPLWEAPDEPQHFQYVKFVAQHGRLPTAADNLPYLSVEPQSEVRQPPLYYVLAASVARWVDLDRNPAWLRNPYFAWNRPPLSNGVALHTLAEAWPFRGMVLGAHLMRACSVLLGAGTVALAYALAREVTQSRQLALLSAALTAFTPVFLLSTASINNDNAVALCSSVSLLAGAKALSGRGRQRWRWLLAFVAASALALASKAEAIFLVPAGLVLALLLVFQQWKWSRRSVAAALLAVVLSAAGCAGWALSMGSSYVVLLRRFRPGSLEGLAPSLRDTFETYWGSLGWDVIRLPASVYAGFLVVLALSALGWALRARAERELLSAVQRRQVVWLGLVVAEVEAGIVYRNTVLFHNQDAAHARFLLPVLAASSLLIVLGLNRLPGWLRRSAAQLTFCLLAFVATWSLVLEPRVFGPQLTTYNLAYAPVRQADIEHISDIRFQNGIRLLGWSSDGAAAPGGKLRLRLFWEAASRPDRNYSAFVHLLDQSGTTFLGQDHSPGSTDYTLPVDWPLDQPVPDDWLIAIPAQLAPGAYRVRVGLYDPTTLAPVLVAEPGGASATVGLQSITILGDS